MSTTGAATTWFKSSFSKEAANCVEVRFAGESVLMRDSKYLRAPGADPARQPVIEVPAARWGAFLDSVVAGESSAGSGLPVVARGVDGVVVSFGGVSLRFTDAEWEAFVSGIAVGEFAAA
ncbi:DUF397 domain-containing protein [Nocardia cyriacigeorgica]|uniref:DUF397 domain-containing protein n=1 Tax=Nocardia cyriacigeorgica TaxID=135487 RepID=A0A5R8PI62_9NOCA|nr:DUF397 domain-containing protein [Nocardia cyriacigeorgica]TLG15701.1 DUF397 domain-containing protein [Nocardia cyriacigeorgica]